LPVRFPVQIVLYRNAEYVLIVWYVGMRSRTVKWSMLYVLQRKNWKRRFFILTSTHLMYCHSIQVGCSERFRSF